MKKNPIIIGIESSCDETAVSIIKCNNILSNVIIHQNIHKNYGGVVPELAAKMHEKNLSIAVEKSFLLANIKKTQLDAVSFTIGPGLIASLLVGCSFSKSLALGLNIPIITVDHIKAHILVHFIKNANINNCEPQFPFLALVISGGHTQIIQVNDYFNMKILGSTLDNAVGEVLDKIAIKFGFNYPGGSTIDMFSKYGNSQKFKFPIPSVKDLNFSFSGIKSYINKFVDCRSINNPLFIKKNIFDLCASIQKLITNILLNKMNMAVMKTNICRIVLAGGVSANNMIRNEFISFCKKNKWELFIPKKKLSTDNGAMIAINGLFKYREKIFDSINVSPYSKFRKF
ncbi:tRNA (adenosine(37)-N6)-threonylcarbamoyltransferase complex transferase subunit TsaD [Blattabacterium cuenoti]|uniref:tRNA (adenosine(37)-N6)-threonylcarbamoyltransferase complex transferase subunit TsaD n=1 Tax=Blattabacterium cuenoti TaxID=1653831 RepID=UPI00163C5953|nr:tRNA (adenosine(37)-N6)-threonylcarbamoyltransferase complex transferase subunit TsaD [Blattabacterium cuenoti]